MKTKFISFGILIGIALTGVIVALSSFAPQETTSKYLTMKAWEYAALYDSKIVIISETGQVEEIPLEKLKASNMIPNAQKIHETINNISKKGYRLVSADGVSYLFEKR